MNTSKASLSELWKGYSKILYFFGQTDENPNIAFSIVLFMGTVLLIVGIVAFVIWKFYKFLTSSKFSDRIEGRAFPDIPVPSPLPTLLYERAGMGPWYESEDFDGEEDEGEEEDQNEIRRAPGPLIINAAFSPEYFIPRQSTISPPPPYEEVDSMFEDIPRF